MSSRIKKKKKEKTQKASQDNTTISSNNMSNVDSGEKNTATRFWIRGYYYIDLPPQNRGNRGLRIRHWRYRMAICFRQMGRTLHIF